ncbi:hypothetical protein NOK96_19060 [Vibrio parahaemolyticus]|uniref:hypothetical protein n=1 Tax=Vibrio parahaemolyticus TaxID=670 RepID=UPI00226B72E4|nr:hypothetical protein [Vibrio parahaemolyticus]MCX8772994.1 hypothetical protein [Vibrio parahaemolyticus]
MNWEFLVTSLLSSTVVVGMVIPFIVKWLKMRLSESIRHEYNLKIEKVRSDFSQNLAKLNDEISRKSKEVDAIRESALNGLKERNSLLLNKKLYAVECIWADVIGLEKVKSLCSIISLLKFDAIVESGRSEITEPLASQIELEDIKCEASKKQRIYVSTSIWAIFEAYKLILSYYVARLKWLDKGLKDEDFEIDRIVEVVSIVLPQSNTQVINEHNLFKQLDALESLLLQEIHEYMHGNDSEIISIENAKIISDLASNAEMQASEA